jgi:hypothetical protein
MKQINFKNLSFAVLLLISNASFGQLQRWLHAPSYVNFTNNGSPIMQPMPTSQQSRRYGNGVYDENGEIHFYVYGQRIYDRQGNQLWALKQFDAATPNNEGANWPASLAVNNRGIQSEIAIIPFYTNAINPCENKYYVFYTLFNNWQSGGNVRFAHLLGCIVTTNALTGRITVEDIRQPNNGPMRILAVSALRNPDEGPTGIAVSNIITSGNNQGVEAATDRFLYFLSGNSLQRIRISPPTAQNPIGLSAPEIVVSQIQLPNVRFNTYELDLSPDGRMLAWGESRFEQIDNTIRLDDPNQPNRSQVDSNFYNVIYLDVNGNFNTHKGYTIIGGMASISTVRGVEFSADNQQIYMNTAGYTQNDGVYVGNASNPLNTTITYINGSDICSNSMLELASNGRMYANSIRRGNDRLVAINTLLNVLNPAMDVAVMEHAMQNVQCDLFNYSFMPVLPDQIDGMDYTPYLLKRYQFDNPLVSGVFQRPQITTNTTWNTGTFNKQVIRLVDGITLTNQSHLTIQNVTIEMSPNADINVCSGCDLTLRNVTIRALSEKSCPTNMWQGIIVHSNSPNAVSDIRIENHTTLRDAITAVRRSGSYVRLTTNTTFFTANETNIHVEGANNQSIMPKFGYVSHGAFHINDVPLIDQNRGSNNGYSDGLSRSLCGVFLRNNDQVFTTVPTQTSNIGLMHNDIFSGGQNGIIMENSGIVNGAAVNFAGMKQHGILVIRNVDIYYMISNNYFVDCKSGISISENRDTFSTKISSLQSNTFVGCESGIKILNSRKKTWSLVSNNFDNCSYGFVYDNNSNTKVDFKSNRIDGTTQYGVHATKNGGTGSLSQAQLTMSGNVFEDDYYPIYIENNKEFARFDIYENIIKNAAYYGLSVFGNKGSEVLANQNTFTNCGYAAINCFDNANVKNTVLSLTNNTIAFDANLLQGTELPSLAMASHNTGIMLAEPTGGNQKYKVLNVSNNTIENLARPIVVNNVIGANRQDPRIFNVPVINKQEIASNIIRVNDIAMPGNQNRAIEVNNGTGINYLGNNMAHQPGSGSASLTGMRMLLSPQVLVYGNYTTLGTGMHAQSNMINSNYYCNTYKRSKTGIWLNERHILRPNFLQIHGVIPDEARHNDYINRPLGATDMLLTRSTSDIRNKWAFSATNPLPIITYSGARNLTPTKIDGGRAKNVCAIVPEEGEWPDWPGDGTQMYIAPEELDEPADKFQALYYRQFAYNNGQHALGGADSNIARLIAVENLMANAQYDSALIEISQIQIPTQHTILQDYVTLYSLYANYKLNNGIRNMADSLVQIVTSIAQKNPVNESPAAIGARAILWHERNMIITEPDTQYVQISGYISDMCDAGTNRNNIPILFENQNQMRTPILAHTDSSGYFVISQESIMQLNPNEQYKLVWQIGGMELFTNYYTLEQFIALSDIELGCGYGYMSRQTPPVESSANSGSAFHVYPNPTNNILHIQTTDGIVNVKLVNILGQTVYSGLETAIDMRSLPIGMYYLHVTTTAQQYVEPIIKQ